MEINEMLQEAFARFASSAEATLPSRTERAPSKTSRSRLQQIAGALIIAVPALLATSSANAAVMNLLYEGYHLDVSSVWGTDPKGHSSPKPPGSIESEKQSGSLFSSTSTSNRIEVSSNTAWSSARNQASSSRSGLYVSLVTNLDDDSRIPADNPELNSTRSIWNTFFTIDGADASLDLFGRYLNSDYMKSEIYLFDFTDRTTTRFGHDTDSPSHDLEDGHVYALSAISSQKERGLDEIIDTGFFINSVSINSLIAPPSPPGLLGISSTGPGPSSVRSDVYLTSLDEAREVYTHYLDIPEPSSLLLFASGLFGLTRIRKLEQSR
jgi:hypothetical protein